MSKKEMLAYLAGLVDGEGYIGIKKDLIKSRGLNPVFYERLSIASIDKPTIDMLVDFFKCGKIYWHKPSKLSKRGYWSWEISNKICIFVLKQLYPYIKIKKPEIDIIFQLRKSIIENKSKLLSKEIIDYREKLYQSIKKIHTFIPL